jgi:hypothetical protein
VLSRLCGESSRDFLSELDIETTGSRAMDDADGPQVAKLFYERLFARDVITLDAIPYALDYAVGELRKSGVPAKRWATFIHMGA